MIIYKLTNKVNNKVYIGQTRSSMKKRFSQHCETRNKTAIGLAIKKYGVDNFEYSVLCENIETLEKLNKKEIEYINLYNSISPNGYNIESGGKVILANAESMSNEYTEDENKLVDNIEETIVYIQKEIDKIYTYDDWNDLEKDS